MPQTPSLPPRRLLGRGLAAAVLALLGGAVLPAPGQAQHVADLLVPRGAILFEAWGVFSQGAEAFGNGGRGLPGEAAFRAPLSTQRFPSLAPEEEGLRILLEDPSATLEAGRFVSRLEVNDQRVPLRLGYGILDRVTVGVTVPIVRRRMDALLQVSGEGANVGRNPLQTQGLGPQVITFRDEVAQSVLALSQAVDARCAEEGESSAACLEGRSLEARAGGLLDQLNDAWNTLDLFPLAGSAAGSALRNRWAGVRGELEGWGVGTPETLPLATQTAAGFLRQNLSDPLWGTEGFPAAPPDDGLYSLGDLELHAVVGLPGMRGSGSNGAAGSGLRVRSAVEATLRLGTGQLDSFAVVTPMDPVAGHDGFGVRWVTDLLLGDRAGLLVDLGWQTVGEGEGMLLAFDPLNAWNPAAARVNARGAPGDRLRLALTPRFLLVPGLSLGAGVEMVRTGEGRWDAEGVPPGADAQEGEGDLVLSRTIPAWSRQDLSLELRFAGWGEEVASGLPFPIEVTLRALRSVRGDGEALAQTRLEMGARLLRRTGRSAPTP